MKEQYRRNISIILPYLNSYRVPFFDTLRRDLAACEIGLGVYTGQPTGVDSARNDISDGYPAYEMRAWVKSTKLGELQLRAVPPRAFRSDGLIVEHAVKNLDSHFLLNRPRRQKVGIWGHGHTITKKQTDLDRTLQKAMVRRADWYFGYTAGSVKRAKNLGMAAERCTEVRNTIDTALLGSLRAEYPRQSVMNGRWSALYVGGLDESKRIQFLLDAAERIHATDRRFQLLVVGDGESRALVDRAARTDWCEYLGRFAIAERFEKVKDAQVVFMPGRVGLAAVDSFAMQAPIVTTEWDWHAPEFEYLSKENSVVVPNTIESYVESVVSLMRNREMLRRLQEGCAESASTLSIEDMAGRFADGCERMLSSNRRAML